MKSDYMKKREEEKKAEAATLKAAGYSWKRRETSDSYDPDEPKYESYLAAPDGIEVSVKQALDEIVRGRDVVRAELAAQQAERQERNRIAQAERDEAARREKESIEVLFTKIAEIKANSTETERVDATWEQVHVVEATDKNRKWDGIWTATINGKTYFKIIVGSYAGDTIEASYWIENVKETTSPSMSSTKSENKGIKVSRFTPEQEHQRLINLFAKLDGYEAKGLDACGRPPLRLWMVR